MSEDKKRKKLFSNAKAAIRFALMIAQEDNQDALEFLQCWIDSDENGISAWDFNGTFNPDHF